MQGIHGYPLVAGIILLAWALASWHYGKSGKHPAWRLCIGGFLVTLGVPIWLDALAGLTATKIGLGILVVVTFGFAAMFWHEVIRGRKRHEIRTPVLGWLFGDAVLLSIGSISRILSHAKHMAPSTGSALASAMTSIRSGHAAAAMPMSHALPVLLVGLLVIVAFVMVGVRLRRGPSGGKGGGKAIAGGKGKKGAKALPAGKGS